MADINRANRQVCDVLILNYADKTGFFDFDTANVTTAGVSGDAVYAMAKGAKRITFPNPIEGTISIEAQVYPYKMFSLFSDGVVSSATTLAERKIVTCAEAGKLSITATVGTPVAASVAVYPLNSFGDNTAKIAGSYADGTFTATTSGNIAVGSKYEVSYLTRTAAGSTGANVIKFTNDKLPKDFFITMKTVDKDENGELTPFYLTAYKASPQRSWELSFNSDGDPATVTWTFDLLEDADKNFLDLIEIPAGD